MLLICSHEGGMLEEFWHQEVAVIYLPTSDDEKESEVHDEGITRVYRANYAALHFTSEGKLPNVFHA